MTEPRLPNLIIAGVGKAGTTSLFWYLGQHSEICASTEKEPKYFRLPDDGPAELLPLEQYSKFFVHCRSERYVMEASPQYFKGGRRTIGAIQRVLGAPRIILMFRDPVDRMWSEYRFKKARMTLPSSLTFDQYVATCERVRDLGEPRTPQTQLYWTFAGGSYADHVTDWLDAFGQDLRIGFFEHMVADPVAFVAETCRWLGIDADEARSFNFSVENKSVQVRNRSLQRLALVANREPFLRSRRQLKAPLRRLYYAINRNPGEERMTPATRDRLTQFFGDSNVRLRGELNRRGYTDLPNWLLPAEGNVTKPHVRHV